MFKNIHEGKHANFTQMNYIQLISQNHETRARGNNKFVISRDSKLKVSKRFYISRYKVVEYDSG